MHSCPMCREPAYDPDTIPREIGISCFEEYQENEWLRRAWDYNWPGPRYDVDETLEIFFEIFEWSDELADRLSKLCFHAWLYDFRDL